MSVDGGSHTGFANYPVGGDGGAYIDGEALRSSDLGHQRRHQQHHRVIEDAGRVCPRSLVAAYGGTKGTYPDTVNPTVISTADAYATTPTKGAAKGILTRAVWRWADPDAGGSGICGPRLTTRPRQAVAGQITGGATARSPQAR